MGYELIHAEEPITSQDKRDCSCKKSIKYEMTRRKQKMQTNHEPSAACILSMNFAAAVIQFSMSSLLYLGYNFLNNANA